MNHEKHRISVEVLENGFVVEVPDMEAIAEKKAAAKKAKQPEPYLGDATMKYTAKTVKEAIKLVTESLQGLEDGEYDTAFEEASKAT